MYFWLLPLTKYALAWIPMLVIAVANGAIRQLMAASLCVV
jgi:hypothetical protein